MSDLQEKLNSMTPQEVLKMIDENPDLNMLVPAKHFLSPMTNFTNEYTDDFKNVNGPWIQEITDRYTLMIDMGKYHFYHGSDKGSQVTYVPLGISENGNWAWEANIEVVEATDDAQIGLLLGQSDTGNGSYFIINSKKQHYAIADLEDNNWTLYKNEEVSLSIHPKLNKLRAECVKGKAKYFINDYFIGERPLEKTFGNFFGFTIFGKAKIKIDSVKINW